MKTKIDVLDRKLGDLLNEVSPKAYKRILEAMVEYAEQKKYHKCEHCGKKLNATLPRFCDIICARLGQTKEPLPQPLKEEEESK